MRGRGLLEVEDDMGVIKGDGKQIKLKNEYKIKTFWEIKLKQFISSRQHYKKWLSPQAEEKWHQMEIWIYAKKWKTSEIVSTWINIKYVFNLKISSSNIWLFKK